MDRCFCDACDAVCRGVPNTAALVATQAVPLLPSGQQPPMYARNHFNFWRKGMEGLDTELTKDGKNIGDFNMNGGTQYLSILVIVVVIGIVVVIKMEDYHIHPSFW